MTKHWMIMSWAMALSLTGCINLGPGTASPMHDYQLQNGNVPLPQLPKSSCTVSVQEGFTVPAYRSNAMAYQMNPYQVDYFAQNQWQVTPSVMIVNNLAEALQGTNGFKAVVVTPPYVGQVDRMVYVNLLKLSQDFEPKSPRVYEQLRVQLVVSRGDSRQVVSQQTFDLKVPTAANPLAGVDGANQAWQQLLPSMMAYVYHECL